MIFRLKKTIGLSLVMALTINMLNLNSAHAANPELNPVDEVCVSLHPNFYDKDRNISKDWELPDDFPSSEFNKYRDNAADKYHSYVQCIFQFAEDTILKSGGQRQGGIVEANTPNTRVIDWMLPDQACLDPTEIREIATSTQPGQMLEPLLTAYNDYTDYLDVILKAYLDSPTETNEEGEEITGTDKFYLKTSNLTQIERELQMEVEQAKVAMDISLHSLKELRSAFVMHVHFQCTLKYLEKYRRELERLRRLIDPLPGQLRDASITK